VNITENYLHMCEKATEIQGKVTTLEIGDFVWKGKKYLKWAIGVNAVYDRLIEPGEVWLPRQSQLQDMLRYDRKRVSDLDILHGLIFELDMRYAKGFCHLSMEEMWLAVVMKKKYFKFWNESKWKSIAEE